MPDLQHLAPLDPSSWDDELEYVVADMQGRPLNIHRLIAHHPGLLKAWWSFRNHCVHDCSLSPRHKELVVLRTAQHVKSDYEWDSHVERGLKVGLSMSEIERVRESPPSSDWSAADGLVLRMVDECMQAQQISAATLQAAEADFSAAEVLDVMAITSTYFFLASVAKTWDLELDAFLKPAAKS